MNSGEIYGNSATNGGGVYIAGGTFTMNGGEIYGNTANYNGGGVYIHNDVNIAGGTFIMNGGKIYGNTSKVDYRNGYGGGGVYVSVTKTFYMNGGVIYGNSATIGGGVYVAGSTLNRAELRMSGGIIVGSSMYTYGGTEYIENTADTYAAALYLYYSNGYYETTSGWTLYSNIPSPQEATIRVAGGVLYLNDVPQ